jgi:hypothetical protein
VSALGSARLLFAHKVGCSHIGCNWCVGTTTGV